MRRNRPCSSRSQRHSPARPRRRRRAPAAPGLERDARSRRAGLTGSVERDLAAGAARLAAPGIGRDVRAGGRAVLQAAHGRAGHQVPVQASNGLAAQQPHAARHARHTQRVVGHCAHRARAVRAVAVRILRRAAARGSAMRRACSVAGWVRIRAGQDRAASGHPARHARAQINITSRQTVTLRLVVMPAPRALYRPPCRSAITTLCPLESPAAYKPSALPTNTANPAALPTHTASEPQPPGRGAR